MIHIVFNSEHIVEDVLTSAVDGVHLALDYSFKQVAHALQGIGVAPPQALEEQIALFCVEHAKAYYLCVVHVHEAIHLIVLDISKQCEKYFDIAALQREPLLCAAWSWNMLHQRITWSDEMFDMFGESRGAYQPAYEDFLQYVPKHEYQKIETAIMTALNHNSAYSVTHTIVQRSGKRLLVEAFGVIVKDKQANNMILLGVTFDCTTLF